MSKYFILNGKQKVTLNRDVDKETVKILFKSFSLELCQADLEDVEDYIFKIGEVQIPDLNVEKEFVICVNESGVAIVGKDRNALVRAILVFMQNIDLCEENVAKIPYCRWESDYKLSNRMIHFCVFPATDFYFLKRMIRLCGLCQYTHVVLEFWGTLQFDCLKELAWPFAYTKEQAKELIDEIRNFGMEPIPMINSLGHASFARGCYGKHVVLDQNPKLQYLFTSDGWGWNIESSKVYALMKAIREELYELFGEGEYIHIGCDEAYYYSRCDEKKKLLPGYMSKLTADIEKENRRPMIWMDMFLEKDKYKDCYTAGVSGEVEELVNALSAKTVLIDWQYDIREAPVESLEFLAGNERDAMGAPWLCLKNVQAHVETLTKNNMFGIMLTTWHTLKADGPLIYACALEFGGSFEWAKYSYYNEAMATLVRKISFEGIDYSSSGWAREEIDV